MKMSCVFKFVGSLASQVKFVAMVALGVIMLAHAAHAANPTSQTDSTAPRLIMVEQHGCAYCAIWNEKIGPIYPKTTAGAIAPLERVDFADVNSIDVDKLRPVGFTPSFLLVQDGVEIARIDGYPGEDFFWGLLEMYLKENDLWQDP